MANQAMTQSFKSTKTAISKKALHTPFSGANGIPEMVGLIGRRSYDQQTAASGTTKRVAEHDGKIRKALIAVTALPAAGEDMVFDVQVNGVSILSATPQLTNAATTTTGLYDFLSLVVAASSSIKVGDIVSVVRTYTAGGGPTPIGANEVILEWG